MASPLQELITQIQNLATDIGNALQLRGFKTGGTAGQVPVKTNGTDFNWSWGDAGGDTNLSVTRNATTVTVASDTGNDAVIPAADGTNAGLMVPAQFTKLSNLSGTNTGDQDISGKLDISTAASTYAPISTKGMRTFVNDAARLAATPDFVGQIGFLASTEAYYFAPTLDTGDWVETLEMIVRKAVEADALKTARTIGGSSFDGSGNVTSFPSPGPIGGTTPAAVNATTVTASGAVTSTKSYVYGQPQFTTASGNAGFQIANDAQLILYANGKAILAIADGVSGIRITNDRVLGFVNGHAAANNPDTAFSRKSGTPGTMQLGNGTLGSTAGSLELTNLTASGTVTGASFIEGVTALGTVGASATIVISTGSVVTATLTDSTACAFTMPTAAAGLSFILHLRQAATTATAATFIGVIWAGGSAPVITATAGRVDILSFVTTRNAAGTGWLWTGSVIQNIALP